MKQAVYPALGIVLLATLVGSSPASAQLQRTTTYAPCGVTSATDYCNSPSSAGTIEKRNATETQLATTFRFSNYTSNVANANTSTNDIFQLTSAFNQQIIGRALVWRQDNANALPAGTYENTTVNESTPLYSRVLLTFSREVSNLSFTIQDIDKSTLTSSASTGGSDFTDEVDFYPLNGSGQPTDMSYGKVLGSIGNPNTCTYLGPHTVQNKTQVSLRGTGVNGTTSTGGRNGNVTIMFTEPVKSIWLTYRDLNTDPTTSQRLQTIAIENISWCAQADLTTAITRPQATIMPNVMSKFEVSFSNVGDLATDNTAATVQLPTNLRDVTVTSNTGAVIGSYNATTGLVTYNAASNAALAVYGGSFSSVINYRAPNALVTIPATATVATSTSEGLNPSPNTASTSTDVAGTLPVALASFDAKAAGSDARLTWTTADEKNNDYFGVERSLDGVSFTAIGRVAGHGTTSTFSSYAYADAGVAAKATGPVYYRLRQVDLDGTATYSPVRTVAFATSPAALKLYPNPAAPGNDNLTLDLVTLPQGEYQASILNVVGSTVATYTVRGGEAQPLTLPATLAAGTYLVRLQGQGMSLMQRLARQ